MQKDGSAQIHSVFTHGLQYRRVGRQKSAQARMFQATSRLLDIAITDAKVASRCKSTGKSKPRRAAILFSTGYAGLIQ
jgi:hypothetical protein